MCGIAGYIGYQTISDERVSRCLARMKHRGPDGSGYYRHVSAGKWQVCLLHTRLIVIDPEPASAQPFQVGDLALVYNGELYNYLELRGDLEKEGITLRSAGDTEIFLRWFDRFGPAGLDACEGMWAAAIYHEADGSLSLIRDRFGEKPLYILRNKDGVYFGSEPKFIFTLSGRTPPVNTRHILRYLTLGYRSLFQTEDTFFQGLERVPPGGITTIRPDIQFKSNRYWTMPQTEEEPMDFRDAASGVRDRLIRAVELRLRSDVPLAFCLSGGVDSNSLLAVTRRFFSNDVHAFTIVHRDERYDEQEQVDLAVAELGIQHAGLGLDTEDFLPKLRALVRQHDSPVSTITYFVHHLLIEQIAASGFKVAISGTGADELFTGYYDHHNQYLYEAASDPAWQATALSSWEKFVRPQLRNPLLADPNLFIDHPDRRDHLHADIKILSSRLHPDIDLSFQEHAYHPGLLRNRLLNELFHEVVPVVLHEDDLNCMGHSVENRSPFLDRNLFEFSLKIPVRHLIRDGYTKALLREAMRGIVPEQILDCRRKVGFNAPIFDLLNHKDKAVRDSVLEDGPLYEIVRRDALDNLMNMNKLSNIDSQFLFNALCVKMFLEDFS